MSLLRGLKLNWPVLAVVVQLVLIAALTGWLAADVIFPGARQDLGRPQMASDIG